MGRQKVRYMAGFRVELPGDDEDPAIVADINITPLVDVVLVLLILFMVGSSAMVDAAREAQSADKERIELHLPSASESSTPQHETPVLVISLTTDGRRFVDGEPIEPAAIAALLEHKHAEAPQTAIILDADGAVPHAQVVILLDLAQAAGFTQVGIGTEHAAAAP